MKLLGNRQLVIISLGHFVVDVFGNMGSVLLTFFSLPMGLSNAQIGLAASLYTFTASLLQPVFGWMADRHGSRWFGAGGLLWALSFLSLAVILGQPGMLAGANDELASLDLAPLSADDFQGAENRQLFRAFLDLTGGETSQGAPSPDQIFSRVDPVLQPLVNLLHARWEALPAAPAEMQQKELVSLILRLRDRHLKEEVSSLRFLQREAEENHDEEQCLRYQTSANAAKDKLRLIQHANLRRSIVGRRRAEAERLGLVNN